MRISRIRTDHDDSGAGVVDIWIEVAGISVEKSALLAQVLRSEVEVFVRVNQEDLS